MDRALLFGVKKCLQLGYEGGNFFIIFDDCLQYKPNTHRVSTAYTTRNCTSV